MILVYSMTFICGPDQHWRLWEVFTGLPQCQIDITQGHMAFVTGVEQGDIQVSYFCSRIWNKHPFLASFTLCAFCWWFYCFKWA